MKKILLAVLAMGLVATSAMAIDGKVGKIKFDGKGDSISFTVSKTEGGETGFNPIVATTPEMVKSLTAAVLTAKAGDFVISAGTKNIDGVTGWGFFVIK